MSIDLFDAGLPLTFNLKTKNKQKKTPKYVKCNKVKFNKMKYARNKS